MKDLVAWVAAMEEMARSLYAGASAYFREDKSFSNFLEHMARDEEGHCRLIKRASDVLATSPGFRPLIAPDDQTRSLVELPLRRNLALLSRRSLTRESLIDCMVTTEFSEWNDIFLYAINSLKEVDGDFTAAAPDVQHHLRHLEQFLETTPYGRDKLAALRNLPAVWEEQILVVEDNAILAQLIEALLAREGGVAMVHNGEEGLRKVDERYYRVIISDVDMPVMNGLQFFEEATGRHPQIRNRFIFITGDPSPERVEFFTKNRVRYLCKPFSVAEMRRVVHDVMELNVAP